MIVYVDPKMPLDLRCVTGVHATVADAIRWLSGPRYAPMGSVSGSLRKYWGHVGD